MNTPSQFQAQFPLSPKKFIKKMMGECITGLIFSIILGLFPAFIAMAFSDSLTVGAQEFVSVLALSALIIFIIRTALYAWYWRVYINRYFYDIGEAFVTIKKGVFMPTEIHVQYQKIQDVYVDQDLWDRILGIYDVHIASATVSSGIEAHIDGVDFEVAEGLKNLLLNSITSGGAQATAPAPRSAVTFQSAQEISQKTYPISSLWIVQKTIGGLFYTVAIILFVWISIFSPQKNNSMSIAEMIHLGNRGPALPIIVFLVSWVGSVIYNIWWRSTYKFEFLPDYLFVREGIITIQEKHIPYNTVQDVIISQGFVERILGLGTVKIQNAAAPQLFQGKIPHGGIVIPGQPIARAQELSGIIKGVLAAQQGSATGL